MTRPQQPGNIPDSDRAWVAQAQAYAHEVVGWAIGQGFKIGHKLMFDLYEDLPEVAVNMFAAIIISAGYRPFVKRIPR
jgi:histone acetyltransferase (RNA polymerase elongator complex component)